MTTYVAFSPSPTAAFSFRATFDSQTYTVTITWNLFAQRWYLNITDLSGNLVVCAALVGSPDGYDINMAFGYFRTSTLIYRVSTNNFEITP